MAKLSAIQKNQKRIKLVNKYNLKRSKLNTNYSFEKDSIIIKSNSSFIGTNKFDYNGKIDLDPFDFQIWVLFVYFSN